MKKKINIFVFIVLSNISFAQDNNNTDIHKGYVLGSYQIGNQQVTSIYDENTNCIRKTYTHQIGLFTPNQEVDIIFSDNQNIAEINSVDGKIQVNSNCDSDLSSSDVVYSLDIFENIPNTFDLEQLMSNPLDLDEQKLNNQLYILALATKELIKDAGFNQIILKLATESGNNTAYLLDLETRAKKYYDAINLKLIQYNTNLKDIARLMTHSPTNPNPSVPESAIIEKYEPAIFVPNLNNLNRFNQPLISPNIEVNNLLKEDQENLEDFVITWYYDVFGSQYEVLIGEQIANNIKNPIFLLDHASLKTKGLGFKSKEKTEPACNGNIRFDSKEIRINPGYRHETGPLNKSEFAIVGYLTTIGQPLPQWVYNPEGWKKNWRD